MATRKLNFFASNHHGATKNRIWLRVLLGVLALMIVVFSAIYGGTIRSTALAGSAFGARIGCSCHFVEGRDIKDCRKDFEPGMGMVMLSSDEAEKTVIGRVPLLASQTASFREGEGCVLEKWAD